jgi:uncharacterized protein YuzE
VEIAYDATADAMYFRRLSDEDTVSRTEELDEGTLVDLTEDGRVVGVEVLAWSQARSWLDLVLDRFGGDLDESDLLVLKIQAATQHQVRRLSSSGLHQPRPITTAPISEVRFDDDTTSGALVLS